MIKAKKICNKCRRIKGLSCDCPPPKKYTSFKQNNYKLYNSRKWRKYAHALRKDNPLCKHCLEETLVFHGINDTMADCSKCESSDTMEKLLSTPIVLKKEKKDKKKVGQTTKEYIEANREILENQKKEAKKESYEPT